MESAYDRIYRDILVEFPRFKIVLKKRSRLQRFIGWLLKILTFGKQNAYMTKYATLIGNTLYIPEDWMRRNEDQRAVTLHHERVHMRQFYKYGYILMTILYLFIPLPVFLAYFRAKFEKEAYEQTLLATYKIFGKLELCSNYLKEKILRQFTSAAYLWMWPFKKSLEKWYDGVVMKILS